MFEHLLPSYFEWWNIPFLFLAGLAGESFGSLIGGGSFITLPALLFVGTPLQSAVAINTAAALGTEAGILSETHKKVFEHRKLVVLMAVPIFAGGVVGTHLLLHVSKSAIKYSVITAMIAILLYNYLSKKKPTPDTASRKSYAALIVFCFFIGVYTNFVSIGEGTFSKVGLMSILGLTFIQSQGLKSTATMPTRFYSLVVTAINGLIIWPYLVTKWCSNFIAGKYATKFAKKLPDHYIQIVLNCFTVIFILYLIFFYK